MGSFTSAATTDDYYLVLARLLPYKRIDIVIEAFNRLKRPLLVVGNGPDAARLLRLAGPTVRFTGRVGGDAVRRYLSHCRALVFPGDEGLGIAPLEAMASGHPVLAYRAGGALETVLDGVTGQFFDAHGFDPAVLRTHVSEFDLPIFQQRLRAII